MNDLKWLLKKWKALLTAKVEEKREPPSLKHLQKEEEDFEEDAEEMKEFILKGKEFKKRLERQKKRRISLRKGRRKKRYNARHK